MDVPKIPPMKPAQEEDGGNQLALVMMQAEFDAIRQQRDTVMQREILLQREAAKVRFQLMEKIAALTKELEAVKGKNA